MRELLNEGVNIEVKDRVRRGDGGGGGRRRRGEGGGGGGECDRGLCGDDSTLFLCVCDWVVGVSCYWSDPVVLVMITNRAKWYIYISFLLQFL